MNDHRLPPDELASAFLDDELTAAESESVRQDPELTARADALRQATEAVGETVTPPPGAADAAVEAALADFDAHRHTPADMTRRRPRRFAVITGVAAAVAVGFIVAAAVALFAERDGDDADTAAAPQLVEAPALPAAPAAAAEAAAAAAEPPPPAAPEPAPEPPPPPPAEDLAAPAVVVEPPPASAETEAMEAVQAAEAMAQEALELAEAAQAAAELAQATAAGNQDAVAAAEAELAEAQAAAEAAMAEAAAAQAEAAAAQAEAAAAEAAAEAAPAAAAAAAEAPAPPPAADDMAADDMAADDMTAGPAPDACAAAIGDGAVELRITVGDTPLLVVRSAAEEATVLDAATCTEIPPDEPVEPAPDPCAAAIGDGAVELRITVGDTPLLVVRSAAEEATVLDAATCTEIPPG